jgi:hypothetical protein
MVRHKKRVEAMTAPRPRSRQQPKQLDAGIFQAEISSFALRLAAEGKAAKTIRTYTEAVQWFAAARLPGQASWEQVGSQQWMTWLLIRLPGRPQVSVDVGDADLSHYRLEFTGQHNVSLSGSDGGDGVVRGRPLSEIIEELNDRFGLDLGTSDRILVLQQVASLVEDTSMQQVALMNDEARFGQVVDDRLDDVVAENAERNTEFMKLYFDNTEFQKAIKEAARKRAYRIITDPARDEALARLRAEMAKETGVLGRGEP